MARKRMPKRFQPRALPAEATLLPVGDVSPSPFANPFASERRALRTKLSPEQCAERLRSKLLSRWSPGFWLPMGARHDRPVFGRVYPGGFILKKVSGYRNSFQTQARGELIPLDGGGTRITVHLALSGWVLLFVAVWVVALLLAYGSMLTGALASGDGESLRMVVLTFPLMLCVGLGIVLFGRYLARDDGDFLVRFLCDTLRAEPVAEAADEPASKEAPVSAPSQSG